LREKFGKDYAFGEGPEDFQNVENYRKIVNSLLTGNTNINAKELEGGLLGKELFT
jgi:hypothetical protein